MKQINATEKRYPREIFTRKLVKLCQHLDQISIERVSWKSRYSDETTTNIIKIQNLWVVGSYARGALECGDLDLVINFTSEDIVRPGLHDVVKCFFGRVQNTSFFEGTPEQNSSYVPFPDAVDIWSGPGCDWEKAIESITPNPDAGRASRPSDLIPLRLSQLNTTFERVDEIISMLDAGTIESEFVPFTADLLEPLTDEDKKALISENWQRVGLATEKILPAIVRVLEEKDPYFDFSTLDRSIFRIGGTNVHVGNPIIPKLTVLDDISVRQLAIVPHLCAKGPNGVWFIRRGPNHPLLKSFKNKRAYVLTRDNEANYIEESFLGSYQRSWVLDTYTSRKSAKEGLEAWTDGLSSDDAAAYSIAQLSGKSLHDAVSGCDIVEVDSMAFPLNHNAAINMGEKKCEPIDLLKSFLEMKSPRTTKVNRQTRVEDPEIFCL
ncbi:hypothetical protein P5704_024505 (plasmid) [Pseudomonas sp. FeN3W]|nr:hypothetical protein P5704_024505 [Pseudomonas sp. FeN3W]